MTLKFSGRKPETNGHLTVGSPIAARYPTFKVEVSSKAGFPDATGAAVLAQLPFIGIQSVTEVQVGALYEISGRLSLSQATAAANQLLADPITQENHVNDGTMAASNTGTGPHWRIEVWLKPSVTDPIAESVQKAMIDLGLPKPETVRSGAVYKLMGRMNQNLAEKIAMKLLVNPVIHRFSIEPR